jgi:hypothetical protein
MKNSLSLKFILMLCFFYSTALADCVIPDSINQMTDKKLQEEAKSFFLTHCIDPTPKLPAPSYPTAPPTSPPTSPSLPASPVTPPEIKKVPSAFQRQNPALYQRHLSASQNRLQGNDHLTSYKYFMNIKPVTPSA